MADYGTSGIWLIGEFGPFQHGMIQHSDLSLPPSLVAAFEAWIERYWDHKQWNQPEHEAFNKEGRALAARLKLFVGDKAVVTFQPELWPNGIGSEEPVS